MALLSISRAEEKIKKGNVIAMSGAPKGRAKKQSAKRRLPEEGLIMRIASLRNVRNDGDLGSWRKVCVGPS